LRDEKPMHLAAAEAQPANCIGPSLRSDDKMHLRNFTSVLPKSPYPRVIRTVNYKFAVRGVFMGPNGLRAGWRLLIFFAILVPLGIGAGRIIDLLLSKLQADMYTPLGGLAVMGTLVIALLLASNIMARIERRRISDFGLPWRRAFCRQFWQGAAISFSSLTALLFVLWLAGAFSFGSPALHGADIWKYGALWTLPLFLSALFEDFLYRGYLLFTLTSGIGFWPAALVTSLLMGGGALL